MNRWGRNVVWVHGVGKTWGLRDDGKNVTLFDYNKSEPKIQKLPSLVVAHVDFGSVLPPRRGLPLQGPNLYRPVKARLAEFRLRQGLEQGIERQAKMA